MEMKEFQGKTKDDLEKMLVEARNKLRDLKFKLASNQLKQVHEVKKVKKLIARIRTALGQLEQESK